MSVLECAVRFSETSEIRELKADELDEVINADCT